MLAFVPEWAWPALAQGQVDVPFTDIPESFNPNPAGGTRRLLDLRSLDGPLTPADRFFFIQHYNIPDLSASTWRLALTGLVQKPAELSLADLQSMPSVDVVNGYECSGNSARSLQGLCSNGRFTGVRLHDVLRWVGVQTTAREVIFFGADKGAEDVVFRQNTFKVQQQFARSITLEHAMTPEPLLAWALNGQPRASTASRCASSCRAGTAWRTSSGCRRSGSTRRAWLPILHTRRGPRHYTAVFSNTAQAHRLNRTNDWVVIYWDRGGSHGQCTVVTERGGPREGCRLVRGRERECVTHCAAALPRPSSRSPVSG